MPQRNGPCQTSFSSLLHAALAYAQDYHWPVFPVARAGKRPLTARGFYDATTEPATIQQWWRHWPEANIGLPTGERTGLVVLDVDPRHDGCASLAHLQQRFGPLPLTRTTRTGGGGWHYWFGLPVGGVCTITNATNVAGFSGLDLRGTGGYVVVPPSRHGSGRCYDWLCEEPLAAIPAFLLELARLNLPSLAASAVVKGKERAERGGKRGPALLPLDIARSGRFWLAQAVARAGPGTRNATGFWLACQLRDQGISFSEASTLLQQYARAVGLRGSEPYSEREALRSLSSAYSRGPRSPAWRFRNDNHKGP